MQVSNNLNKYIQLALINSFEMPAVVSNCIYD